VEPLVGGERGQLRYGQGEFRQRRDAAIVELSGLGHEHDRAVRVAVRGPLVETLVRAGRLGHHADLRGPDREHLAGALHAAELLGELARATGHRVAGCVYLGHELARTPAAGHPDPRQVLPDLHPAHPVGEPRLVGPAVRLVGHGEAGRYHLDERVEQLQPCS